MKLSAVALAFSNYFGNSNTENRVLDDVTEEVQNKFAEYLSLYGKSYGTEEEFKFRLSVFNQNLQAINEHNEQNTDDAELSLNHMADWTQTEYKRLLGFRGKKEHHGKHHERKEHHGKHHERKEHHGKRSLEATDDSDLPASVNWVELGAVTPIKNQGTCGSCWAFSTTGSLEGRYFVKENQLVSLSEQQFVDCAGSEGNQGCNGGLMDLAFEYGEKHSIDTEASYPYVGRDGTCAAVEGVVSVKSYKDVAPKSPAALMAAVAEGPVSVAIDAASIGMQFYFGGIIKHLCGTSLDHGVLVVGYGTDDKGTDYWLLKNSWGATWGEKGFFRILRSAEEGKPGVCGLQLQPSYPIV